VPVFGFRDATTRTLPHSHPRFIAEVRLARTWGDWGIA
jgi:hypothetical protein